jgi:hypothetical protein
VNGIALFGVFRVTRSTLAHSAMAEKAAGPKYQKNIATLSAIYNNDYYLISYIYIYIIIKSIISIYGIDKKER